MLDGIYMITGIAGFLGSAIANELINHSAYRSGKIKIIGLVRNKKDKMHIFEKWDTKYLELIEADVTDRQQLFLQMSKCQWEPEFIIHCAATTSSKDMVESPIEVAEGILLGTKNILEYANKGGIRSMVYLSSMEVYGMVPERTERYAEEELGEILLDRARSCYPMSKRMAEHYCYLYQYQYNLPVKIARLAQVFGKGVPKKDNRVFKQFANAILEERDIVLKTNGKSVGNYCETMDAVRGVLLLLEKGVNGEVYNIVNENNTMTIGEMAELVIEEFSNSNVQLRFEMEDERQTGYAPETKLRLSSEKIRALGWMPTKGLREMYQDLLEDMRSD